MPASKTYGNFITASTKMPASSENDLDEHNIKMNGNETSRSVQSFSPGVSELSNIEAASNNQLVYNEQRKDSLAWEEYFMALAFLSAQRSKDPCSQVGACIVNERNQVLSIGYNGMPSGCPDQDMCWGKKDPLEINNKYMYVCHAELNAIVNKNSADVRGGRVYVTLFPCNECAKLIIQSGIVEVVYFSDKHCDKDSTKASKFLLNKRGVYYRKYASSLTQLRLEFNFNAVTQQTSVAATQDAVQQLCSDLRNCCNVETNANVVCSEDTNARGLEPTSTATTTATLSLADPSELPRPSGAYISWEEYFMAVAFLSARRSKDPAVQVGACLVNDERRIVGIGYNGLPNGVHDALVNWHQTDPNSPLFKNFYVCHAEVNAVLNKNYTDVRSCTLYVTAYPCNECVKLLVQSGVRKIVYFSEPGTSDASVVASKKIFALTGVEIFNYMSLGNVRKEVKLDFCIIDN